MEREASRPHIRVSRPSTLKPYPLSFLSLSPPSFFSSFSWCGGALRIGAGGSGEERSRQWRGRMDPVKEGRRDLGDVSKRWRAAGRLQIFWGSSWWSGGH
jgi:hypothetical protein